MPSESMMLYKLIILYMLDRVNFSITNNELTRFIVEKDYATYITVNEALADLIEDKYIDVSEEHNSFLYRITPLGHEALSYFYTKISLAIRDEIDAYLSEQDYQLREMVSTSADYYEEKKNEFVVDLSITERESELIHLKLLVPSEFAADSICNHWKDRSSDVYDYLVSTLTAGSPDQPNPEKKDKPAQ